MQQLMQQELLSRPLSDIEVIKLEKGGNRCLPGTMWSDVRVLSGCKFEPNNLHNTYLGGKVILGDFCKKEHLVKGVRLPSGIYNSTVVNCIVYSNARIANCNLVSRCIVGAHANITGCGTVAMTTASSTFSNGMSVDVVVETGCRSLEVYAEMAFEKAAKVIIDRQDVSLQREWTLDTQSYAKRVSSNYMVVCGDATLLNCARIENSYIGSNALVEGSVIKDSTILSVCLQDEEDNGRTKIQDGCFIDRSIIQWGCCCNSMSIISNSFLFAASSTTHHVKVLHSILGPCSSVSEGEVSASFVG